MYKNAEIIAIGNELITGDVIDTNSALIAKSLLALGIETSIHTSVGDDENQIISLVSKALERSELIFITGGLGPTDDDITAQVVSKCLKRDFILKEEIWEHIKKLLSNTGREIYPFNKKQAYIPKGAKYFLNYSGTAPCILIEEGKKRIFLLPGVPSEVSYFIDKEIKHYLAELNNSKIKIKKIKLSGISEAKVNEVIKDIVDKNPNGIAFLPKSSELVIKITAKAKTENEALQIVDETTQEVVYRLKNYVFGYDDDSIEYLLKDLLTENKLTVAVAESCTGGYISKLLTDVPGSSYYISTNVITYSNEAKMNLLKVSKDTLEKYGAVSEQTAKEMAIGIKNLSNCNIGLSITGIAGPDGGTPIKPVGLVYVGITNGHCSKTEKFIFPEKLSRTEIRTRAAYKALQVLRSFILEL